MDVSDVTVSISFLDVGQGDATLVVDHPSRRAMLIDCPAGKEDVVEQALDRHGAELEVAVITHFDDDHSGGVVTLLETRFCQKLLTRVNVGRRSPTDEAQHRRIYARTRRGLSFTAPKRHDTGVLDGSLGRVRWRVLSPDDETDLAAYSARSRNRASLVLRLEVRSLDRLGVARYFLVAGDADGFVWHRLLSSEDDLACFALLWPHHGASLGRKLGRQLVEACGPDLIVVSAGSRNGYKHPA